mmetsp:Transcript_15839/g.25294  ORF Transcript_15839/g.25294 Transcript_15839/m.25294 type:complete len:111 (+) Transcript_15839:119-451(+)
MACLNPGTMISEVRDPVTPLGVDVTVIQKTAVRSETFCVQFVSQRKFLLLQTSRLKLQGCQKMTAWYAERPEAAGAHPVTCCFERQGRQKLHGRLQKSRFQNFQSHRRRF